MPSKNNILPDLKGLVLASLVFINFVFAWKYLDRITNYSLLASIVYCLIFLGGYIFIKRTNWKPKVYGILTSVLLGGFLILSAVIFAKIEPLSVEVDRWSVITSFWDTAFTGDYPYFAKSHRNAPPGPMPIYFLLALPAYLIGEIGLIPLFGIVWFLVTVARKNSLKNLLIGTFLVLASLPTIYEVMVRSTVFVNSALVLSLLIYLRDFNFKNKGHFIATAIIAGLLLSTRMVYGLTYALTLIYALSEKKITFKKAFVWGLICSLTFAATFAPLLALFPSEFPEVNPFTIQGTYSMEPFWQPIFLALAILGGFIVKDKMKMIAFNGFLMFDIIFIYVVYTLIIMGTGSYWDGSIDISYLVFASPFLIYYLCAPTPTTHSG
jgi:hypothetical protein